MSILLSLGQKHERYHIMKLERLTFNVCKKKQNTFNDISIFFNQITPSADPESLVRGDQTLFPTLTTFFFCFCFLVHKGERGTKYHY